MESSDYFDGKWEIVSIETRTGKSLQPDFDTLYPLLPKDKRPLVSRGKFKTDCFYALFCLSDRYRVERLNPNECRLYSMADPGDDPDNYRFRVKIKRAAW